MDTVRVWVGSPRWEPGECKRRESVATYEIYASACNSYVMNNVGCKATQALGEFEKAMMMMEVGRVALAPRNR